MKLLRPLVVLDLETTGTWIDKDRIIEIGMIKCLPEGDRILYEKRINPGMPIPPRATELTGIKNEDVKNAPFFKDVAREILAFLQNVDLAGFNIERFDLPLLAREFSDVGLEFNWQKQAIYDAQKIYHLHEKRDLTAAYKFYCNKDLLDAHSALADSQATLDVLESQLKKYAKENDSVEALKIFSYQRVDDFYDAERKFRWWNGELYMMFGKYAKKVTLKEVASRDPAYLEWILTQSFSEEVKSLVEGALEGNFPVCDTKQ